MRVDSQQTRRAFLSDLGMGFGGLALGAMLYRDGLARGGETAPALPFAPKAKSVVWLFMIGGVSHVEGFDPKPELNVYAGKTIDETPHKDALTSGFTKNVRIHIENDANGHIRQKLFPLQVGYGKRG